MSLWGNYICLKCETFLTILTISFYCVFIIVYYTPNQTAKRIPAAHRVGPHHHNIISVFYGTLLGDSYAEKRSSGNGTRISFSQESNRSEYLLYLHSLVAEIGYCNPKPPVIQSRLGTCGSVRYIIRFHTFTYSSLNCLHDAWYKNGVKHVPANIAEYLTPIALALWIIDDGGRAGVGLKLSTNSFTFSDSSRLVLVLHELYNIKATVQSAGAAEQYMIYIWKESMPNLRSIVKPYIVSSMLYKLGE